MELKLAFQNYDWGKLGGESIVSKFVLHHNDQEIDLSKPYAELWMGVHPNGPSFLRKDGTSLADFIINNPNILGSEVIESFGNSLPYLFKILSIRKPLSIQAHPTKQIAEVLHKTQPTIYKDPNHKPELAIALTRFEALCGFKPPAEIERLLRLYPKLHPLLPDVDQFFKARIDHRVLFKTLMNQGQVYIDKYLPSILDSQKKSPELELLKRLNRDFPGDVGIFCPFFLNYVVLEPGEALYLDACELHAYLAGDCVECMANSDNVVRAGLTPKFRDVETLCSMLSKNTYTSNSVKFNPKIEDEHSLLFTPPVKDFAVAKISLPAGMTYSLQARKSASIIIALDGCSTGSSRLGELILKNGVAIFLPAQDVFTVQVQTDQIIYQAFCNV